MSRRDAPNTKPTVEDFLSVLGQGIAHFDQDGRLTLSNDKYARLLGLANSDLVSGTEWKIIASAYGVPETTAQTPPTQREPIELHLNGGKWTRVEWCSLANGGFVEVCTDISDLKHRENLIKRHEVVLSTVEKLANMGYFIMDPITLETTFLSEGLLQIAPSLEAETAGVTYGSLVDRVHPDDLERVAEKTIDAVQNGTSINIEFRAITSDGDIQNLWLSNAEIQDIDLEKNVRVGVVQDITDHVAAEEALKINERNFKDAQRIAGVGSWEWDAKTGNISWSDELYRIYQLDPLTVSPDASLLRAMIAPDQAEHVVSVATSALTKGIPYEIDYQIIVGSDQVKHVRACGEPKLNSDGEITKFTGTVQDFSELRKIQRELVDAKEQAEQASASKSEFLAMISHEIRTPMNGVLGTLGVLNQSVLNNEQRSLVRLAMSSGEILNLMLSDVLDFSKIEAGHLDFENVSFRPRLLMSDIAEFWRPAIEGKGLEFEIKLSESVPMIVAGDTARIRQILNNFLSNALKFTDTGHIQIIVDAANHDSKNPGLQFSVIDTGRGISTHDHARVFRAFDQLGTPAHERSGGTGLGLAICRKLTEMMGGTVSFESQLREGSSFKCTLPLKTGNTEELLPESDFDDVTPRTLCHADGEPLRVLLAEDNTTNQIVAKHLLENMQCRVDTVDDGLQAIDAASRRAYDIVLMDINMPVMDGYEATTKLRQRFGETLPIIALTAYAMEQDLAKINAVGMNGFVAKPIVASQLFHAIKNALDHIHLHDLSGNAGSATSTEELIDQEILNSLLSEFEKTARVRLCKSFVADLSAATSILNQFATGDPDIIEIERQSHVLKSVSGTFGAIRLQRRATEFNNYCRASSKPPNHAMISNLSHLAHQSLNAFQKLSITKDRIENE
ncbi:response regulator [Parvibaculum lavamentivorans]|nr:response regulator [Parvibaculum lavamentivorans]